MGDSDGCVALGSYFCPFKDKHVEQRCEDVGEAVIQCRRAQRPSVQGRAPGWTAPHVINMIQPQQRKATCINMPQAPERVHDVKPPHGWHSALTVCIGSALQQEADGGQRPHPRSQVQQAVAVWPVRQAGAPAAASGGKRFLISKAREAGAPAAGAQQRGKVWISKATHVARTERHANAITDGPYRASHNTSVCKHATSGLATSINGFKLTPAAAWRPPRAPPPGRRPWPSAPATQQHVSQAAAR